MIRKIEFENFMSLRNVAIDLKPLIVFIGPNGAGKSAIFKGLTILSKLLNGVPLRGPRGEFITEGVVFDDIVWNGNSGLTIKFRVWFDDDAEEPGYTLELNKRGPGWNVSRERIRAGDGWIEVDEDHPFEHLTERGIPKVHRPPLRATLGYLINPYVNDSVARPVIEPILQLAERFGQAHRYRPSAIDISNFVKPPTEPGHRIRVGENGYGVAAELQALQGSNRELFGQIEQAVCRLFPHITAIGFKTDWQGVRLSFRTARSEDLIPAPQESDGVLIATFLFWRLYTGNPSLKVCLEEPENALHAFLLAERFQALKQFAYRTDNRAIQLLVATHSPEFLRAIKAHPTALWREIRLVDFVAGQGTSVRGLANYREAANLIEGYLTQVHESWKDVAEGWGPREAGGNA